MIVTGVHASKDTPPQVPLITGVATKRKQAETFKDTLANAIVKAAASNYPGPTVVQIPHLQQTITHDQSQEETRMSPGKAAEIRSKSFDQLGTLKKLFEDGINPK